MAAYVETLLVDEFGSSRATARTNQSVRPISSRVADPARWPIRWRIRVRPCIGKHACGTGTCSHGGRRLGTWYNLAASVHLGVQLYSSNVVGPVGCSAVNVYTTAGDRNQWNIYRMIGSTDQWLGKIRRHWWMSSVGMKAAGNTMCLNWHRVSEHYWRHRVGMIRRPLHAAAGNTLTPTKSTGDEERKCGTVCQLTRSQRLLILTEFRNENTLHAVSVLSSLNQVANVKLSPSP